MRTDCFGHVILANHWLLNEATEDNDRRIHQNVQSLILHGQIRSRGSELREKHHEHMSLDARANNQIRLIFLLQEYLHSHSDVHRFEPLVDL